MNRQALLTLPGRVEEVASFAQSWKTRGLVLITALTLLTATSFFLPLLVWRSHPWEVVPSRLRAKLGISWVSKTSSLCLVPVLPLLYLGRTLRGGLTAEGQWSGRALHRKGTGAPEPHIEGAVRSGGLESQGRQGKPQSRKGAGGALYRGGGARLMRLETFPRDRKGGCSWRRLALRPLRKGHRYDGTFHRVRHKDGNFCLANEAKQHSQSILDRWEDEEGE